MKRFRFLTSKYLHKISCRSHLDLPPLLHQGENLNFPKRKDRNKTSESKVETENGIYSQSQSQIAHMHMHKMPENKVLPQKNPFMQPMMMTQ